VWIAKPNLPGSENAVRGRYELCWGRAQAFLKQGNGEGPMIDTAREFQFETDVRLTANQGGRRSRTIGVVVHATRGGTANADTDYRATINFFLAPGTPASAHFVVGPSRVCRMVEDDDQSWHGGVNNATHLGIEIAQPASQPPFSDFQYKAAAAIVREWCRKYDIPAEHVDSQARPGIIGHEETEQGRGVGKTDPGRQFDWAHFMELVRLDEAPSPFVIGEGFRAFLREHPEAGEPRHDEAHDPFGNAYLWLKPTTTYTKGALLHWRKSLNRVTLVSWESGSAPAASLDEYLAAHPEAGVPEHDQQDDVLGNRYVWLAPSARHPSGALVVWRAWMKAVTVVSWDEAATGVDGSAILPLGQVMAQCQILREFYDSDDDFQIWAAPQPNGRFETASCSAAALAALLTAYAHPTNISGAIRLLGDGRISPEVGLKDASLEGMRQALAEIGVAAERAFLDHDRLVRWLNDGTPVILDLPGMFGGIGHILVAVSGDADGCDLVDSADRFRPRWRATREQLADLSRRADGQLAGLRIRPTRSARRARRAAAPAPAQAAPAPARAPTKPTEATAKPPKAAAKPSEAATKPARRRRAPDAKPAAATPKPRRRARRTDRIV
jgi:hypothetical protein